MSMLQLIENSINVAIESLGDLIVDLTVAEEQPVDPQPGKDYAPSYQFHSGKGVFENVDVSDYPDTQVQVGDKSLNVLRCSYDIKPHDFLKVGDTTYHAFAVKPDVVAHKRVLQKVLVREEPKEIEWESGGPVVSFIS